MATDELRIKLDEYAFPPVREHPTDAGLDIKTPVDFIIWQGSSVTIDTGVHIELPKNTVGFIKSKSGLNVKCGIQSEGVIDEGYTGSIVVKLYNNSEEYRRFERGDKIAQLVILNCRYLKPKIVKEIKGGERGNEGFGSTGR